MSPCLGLGRGPLQGWHRQHPTAHDYLRNLTTTILGLTRYMTNVTAPPPCLQAGTDATDDDDREALNADFAEALLLSLGPYCPPVSFRFRKPRRPVGRVCAVPASAYES